MEKHRQRFQELLREMFQFDSSDLDFGIYRIMNFKRDAIERFVQKDLVKAIGKELSSGSHGLQGRVGPQEIVIPSGRVQAQEPSVGRQCQQTGTIGQGQGDGGVPRLRQGRGQRLHHRPRTLPWPSRAATGCFLLIGSISPGVPRLSGPMGQAVL